MGALHINDYKPYLSKKSIDMIVDYIIREIDSYSIDHKQVLVECENGIQIDCHVSYAGMDYRIIQLKYIDVFCGEEPFTYYAEEISNLVYDRIYDLNDKEESNYHEEKEIYEYSYL